MIGTEILNGRRRRDERQRRLGALALALAVETLFVLALLGLFGPPPPRAVERALVALNLRAPAPVGSKAAPRKAVAERRARPPSEVKAPPPPKIVLPSTSYVRVSREDFEAGDIAKLPRRVADAGTGEGSGDTASGSGAGTGGEGRGQGPGGAPLYTAEWYREPTDGELAPYLTGEHRAGSWAMIMCQTAAEYRVENCRPMAESPPGSGLAQSLRRASWQFRVLPPRIGRTALIGAWVRIRFDFRAREE